jgi:hypothetical protein
MNVLLDMEADMDKTHTVCAFGRVDTRDWLGTTHTRKRPIASRRRAEPSRAEPHRRPWRARLVAPHTQTSLAHWNPSRAGLASETRTCMGPFVLSCASNGLATGWSLVQGVLPTVCKCKIKEPHKRRPRPDRAVSAEEEVEELQKNIIMSVVCPLHLIENKCQRYNMIYIYIS